MSASLAGALQRAGILVQSKMVVYSDTQWSLSQLCSSPTAATASSSPITSTLATYANISIVTFALILLDDCRSMTEYYCKSKEPVCNLCDHSRHMQLLRSVTLLHCKRKYSIIRCAARGGSQGGGANQTAGGYWLLCIRAAFGG